MRFGLTAFSLVERRPDVEVYPIERNHRHKNVSALASEKNGRPLP